MRFAMNKLRIESFCTWSLSASRSKDLVVGSVIAILICVTPLIDESPSQLIFFLLAILVPLMLFVRTSTLATALGFLLPIYAVAGTSPTTWDAIRICIVIVLLVKNAKKDFQFSIPLIVFLIVGTLFAAIAMIKTDWIAARYGASLLQACAIVLCIGEKNRKLALSGFVAGATASAVAVILEHYFSTTLGFASQGVTGNIGLGSVSTQTGSLLVLALLVIWFGYSSFSNNQGMVLSLILIAGILHAGSRAGAAALVGLILVALLTSRVRSEVGTKEIFAGALVGAYVLIVRPLSVLRFFPNQSPEFTVVKTAPGSTMKTAVDNFSSYRLRGVESGLEILSNDPWIGSSSEASSNAYVHSTFLSWPAIYGVIGIIAVVAVFVTLAIWGVIWQLLVLIIGVALLEPHGLLAGGSTLPVILMLAGFNRRGFTVNFVRSSVLPDT